MRNKYLLCLLLLVISTTLYANGSQESSKVFSDIKTSDQIIKIGILKFISHPALDEVEQGILDVITEKYPNALFDLQNAKGDIKSAINIAEDFKTNKMDVVVGIATPAAQSLAQVIKDSPVIFSAVTDPVGAGIVSSTNNGKGNVAGISDMSSINEQLEKVISFVNIKTLGMLYTNSESNSKKNLLLTEKACSFFNIGFHSIGVNSPSDVKNATENLAKKVDAIYISTDNTVISEINTIIDIADKNNIPIFSADTTSAQNGGVLIASGFNYYKMGEETARLVIEVINGKDPGSIPVVYLSSTSDFNIIIDLNVAEKLGIKIPKDILSTAKIINN